MNHYADFDLHMIKERNERIRQEVQTSRLEKRLRQNGEPRSSAGLAAFISRSTLLLLRRAGFVG